MSETENKPVDFIRNIINEDLASGKHAGVVTRFPPEPNGYLHIGHAKSLCLNFGISEEYEGAVCNLRFDDTNPEKEDVEYIDAIKADVSWLGFSWNGEPRYASDYFEALYAYAVELVKMGKAYVDSLSAEEIREHRGTLTEAGKNSPYRDRSVEENLALLEGMKRGDYEEGTHILRAKIDMASPNMNMRDPAIYRIRKAEHHRTGEAWCIYPMYDFTHCLSDAMEGITHSLCTLEFADHRPLYDWVLETLKTPCHPQQIEFSRLNLSYTVLSKRKLLQLVDQGHVSGWDDPRMPTISGIRRRGYTPEALRNFCRRIGISKKESRIDYTILEDCVREDLNEKAPRVMGVLAPLKVTVTNYPEELVEEMDAMNHPQKPEMGTRKVPFCRELYIEQSDFMEEPPKKFFRLGPGREVRLRSAYYLTCTDVVKNEAGEVVELLCTYDPESKGGSTPDGRKVKGTIHWVSARHAVNAEVRVYDRLFKVENPEKEGDSFLDNLNPESLTVLTDCKVEPGVVKNDNGAFFQFERTGYFNLDPVDSTPEKPVFNRTATLRDAWAKMNK
ncbi:glutamine--tRNA ligase/YqeY domain fusion protein [Desulfoluna spongiiphila]|uniref:Glutamine--tRNA ligase n=1 Tax=Desulfoluna spongiiphila TaxID=419481 RepID=A0A1G5FRK9_9BACT|nr:glutamine--tRNA ligase/YqeY domain fusion protein [Desulfoluna spongiiphila]SCY41420.1 glutaminyl-tRNA synthetase [Desulfoluna spongiiphila]VVS95465.1 glutamine-trna ligase bacterial [Desulfoluna spongiiphila]